MSRTMLQLIVAVTLVMEGARGVPQQGAKRISFRMSQDTSHADDRSEEPLSNLQLLVPVVEVDRDLPSVAASVRAGTAGREEEEAVRGALSKLLDLLSGGRPGASASRYSSSSSEQRPPSSSVSEHQASCPTCLFVKTLKALALKQLREEENQLVNQLGGQYLDQREVKIVGKTGNKLWMERASQVTEKPRGGREGGAACALCVVEVERARRANNDPDVGPQDPLIPTGKGPVP